MAKRKNGPIKTVGLSPNCICPYCKRKVRNSIKLETGIIIEHWWSRMICSTIKYPTQIEKLAIDKLKKHQYIVKDVMNEPT